MIDLTIDTCVLVDASQKGDLGRARESIELLTEFDRNAKLFLAIDSQGFIRNEYDQNINASMYAQAWLRKFAERTRRVATSPLPQGLRVAFDEAHFSLPDRRFVQVALCTETRIIVTRDPDYSPVVRTILRRNTDIRVLDASEAVPLVRQLSAPILDP